MSKEIVIPLSAVRQRAVGELPLNQPFVSKIVSNLIETAPGDSPESHLNNDRIRAGLDNMACLTSAQEGSRPHVYFTRESLPEMELCSSCDDNQSGGHGCVLESKVLRNIYFPEKDIVDEERFYPVSISRFTPL